MREFAGYQSAEEKDVESITKKSGWQASKKIRAQPDKEERWGRMNVSNSGADDEERATHKEK